MKYCLRLRAEPHYRRSVFESGLRAIGGTPASEDRCDVLVIWNRRVHDNTLATECERRGGAVLVAENAAWGNEFAGQRWYSLARGFHNVQGMFPVGGSERWDALGVELSPWREPGGEIVGLPQRGIGPPQYAMPRYWIPPGCTRIRPHPGIRACKPLQDDLAKASKVVTWGSGAAIKALMWGIAVESHMPQWVAEQDNKDEGRISMFRRLAWAQVTLPEIESGEAFSRALS